MIPCRESCPGNCHSLSYRKRQIWSIIISLRMVMQAWPKQNTDINDIPLRSAKLQRKLGEKHIRNTNWIHIWISVLLPMYIYTFIRRFKRMTNMSIHLETNKGTNPHLNIISITHRSCCIDHRSPLNILSTVIYISIIHYPK